MRLVIDPVGFQLMTKENSPKDILRTTANEWMNETFIFLFSTCAIIMRNNLNDI
jgi:hypothetical protein